MAENILTLGLGSAGTGKSFMAIGYAAQELAADRIARVVLSRPMVQCGDGLGFLPGDLHAKVSPFLEPLLDALGAFFSKADIDKLIEIERVRIIPLELMRGHSHKNTIIVLDEGQNASKRQLDMAITRIDHGTKLILTGDEIQSDIGLSPLIEMVKKLSKPSLLESMGVVRFTRADNMRSPFVAAACERLGI